ncbi:MAG: cyclase family protein, partial [Thermoplasmata archaeon]
SAVMLDVRKDAEGTIVSQKSVEKRWPKGMHPDFVLFQTGWSRDRAPTKHYLYDFPGISPEAAEWLVHKSVKGVGTDALGIDPYANSKFEAHKVLLRKGIWILEALDHLEDLSERVEYTLIAAPLKIAGASGAMARVFAIEG